MGGIGMNRYSDIDPMDIDPDTGRPYAGYSSPSLDTSFHDGEQADRGMAAWLRWCRKVEGLLGIKTLDGDQIEDGYSLDFANEAFDDGYTPEQYAARVRDGWHLNGGAA